MCEQKSAVDAEAVGEQYLSIEIGRFGSIQYRARGADGGANRPA